MLQLWMELKKKRKKKEISSTIELNNDDLISRVKQRRFFSRVKRINSYVHFGTCNMYMYINRGHQPGQHSRSRGPCARQSEPSR